jgi:predicted nucleotidyltransferase
MAYRRRMAGTLPHRHFDSNRVRDAVLRVLPDAETIYLFGSHARGNARADSDLDLAVLGTTPLASMQRFESQRELSALLDCDVDLIDLHNANSVLRSEVVNGGKLLFQRNAATTLDFEARVIGEYAELLEATRALRDDIRQRGRVHA